VDLLLVAQFHRQVDALQVGVGHRAASRVHGVLDDAA